MGNNNILGKMLPKWKTIDGAGNFYYCKFGNHDQHRIFIERIHLQTYKDQYIAKYCKERPEYIFEWSIVNGDPSIGYNYESIPAFNTMSGICNSLEEAKTNSFKMMELLLGNKKTN